ncbi:MAG TPA: fatty acid--CoA ligase family protein [Verrucomicrobiae bacterium]|nr:fatty acid--CoA ligase family protein [Verrucomicrobiae bacterium]
MLYESWRHIASSARGELALWDLPTGRRWTFEQLAAAAESRSAPDEGLVCPHGGSAEFVLEVLGAWRSGRVVCPLESGQAPPLLARELPAGIVHLKTTSASTGAPRLVAFTAEQLMADAGNIVATMGLRPGWPNLAVISLAHSYGFSNLVLPLLLHRIPLVLLGGPLPEMLRRAVVSLSHLTLPAVPALWRAWQDAHAIPAHVSLAISAGAPLPLELEQRVFADHGLKIHNFYGSSECGGIAYDRSDVPRTDAAFAGQPLAGVSVDIGKSNCLEVRSAAVAETYFPEPEPVLQDGRFVTSDLARLDGGAVYLLGRAGDQINVAGRKVLPEAIESVLAAHPEVRGCLAFGIPSDDPQRGETIVACVTGSSEVSPAALREFALTHLAAWQVPRKWWIVPELPANGRGKLSRAEWRERYLRQANGNGNGHLCSKA